MKSFTLKISLILTAIIALNSLLSAPANTAKEQNPPADDGLARVAIINIINMSKNPAVEWVSTSLPDAIYKSMEAKFEFKRSETNATQKIADDVLAERLKADPKKTSKEGVPDSTTFMKFHSRDEVEKIAAQSKSDIVIYGGFVLNSAEVEDPKTKKKTVQETLQVSVFVYHVAGKKIIGTSSVENKIDGSLFEAIDKVAAQIVNDIYKFALSLSGEQSDQEKVRIMVLVPTWKSLDEEKKAKNEIEEMRKYLSGKYQAKFVTLDEFFEAQKVPAKTREQVLDLAKNKKKAEIITWLEKMGVKDAFIVLVENNRVNITPVVEGKVEKETSYNSNAKPNEKLAAYETVSKQSGMTEKKKDEKITISKKAVEEKTKETPTYNGMLWRDAILPGWGHHYFDKENFWLYYGVYTGVTANFVVSIVQATQRVSQYDYERNTHDMDRRYEEANKAFRYATMSGFLFLASYGAVFSDALFHNYAVKDATFFSMLWRDAAFPGMGHYYGGKKHADIYSGLSIGLAGLFLHNEISLHYARDKYLNSTGDIEDTFRDSNDLWRNRAFLITLYAGNMSAALLELTLQKYNVQGGDLLPKLWRSAVIPGWGSDNSKTFWYANFFSYSLYFSLFSSLQSWYKEDIYLEETNAIDETYFNYQETFYERNLWLSVLIGSYMASVSDVLITHYDKAPVSLWGKIWRSLAIPGWAQVKDGDARGALYLNAFYVSALSTVVALTQNSYSGESYRSTTENFDNYYENYNDANRRAKAWLVTTLGVYLVTLADSIVGHYFFKKGVPAKEESSAATDGKKLSGFFAPPPANEEPFSDIAVRFSFEPEDRLANNLKAWEVPQSYGRLYVEGRF